MYVRPFIHFLVSKFQKNQKEFLFKTYVTDCLKIIAENTANFAGGHTINKRFCEFFEKEVEETRTPEEIVSNIKNKLSGGSKDESIRSIR